MHLNTFVHQYALPDQYQYAMTQTHYTTLVKVKEAFDQGIPQEDKSGAQGHAARQLFILGQYVRDGVHIFEGQEGAAPSAQQALQLALQFLHHPQGLRCCLCLFGCAF